MDTIHRQNNKTAENKAEQLIDISSIEQLVKEGHLHIALMLPERYERIGITPEKALKISNEVLAESKPAYININRDTFYSHHYLLTKNLDHTRMACPSGKRTNKILDNLMKIEHTADQILYHMGNNQIPELTDDRINLTKFTITFLIGTKQLEQYDNKHPWGEFLKQRNQTAERITKLIILLNPLDYQIVHHSSDSNPENRDYAFLLTTIHK